MKKVANGLLIALAAIILLSFSHADAQVTPGQQIRYVTVAPSGACPTTGIALLTPTGVLYTCQSGAWASIGSGGGTPATLSACAVSVTASAQISVTGCNISTPDAVIVVAASTCTGLGAAAGNGLVLVYFTDAGSVICDKSTAVTFATSWTSSPLGSQAISSATPSAQRYRQLASVAVSGGVFGAVTDLRVWFGLPSLSQGTCITIDNTTNVISINPIVCPTLAGTNTWLGANDFSAATVTGIMPTIGGSYAWGVPDTGGATAVPTTNRVYGGVLDIHGSIANACAPVFASSGDTVYFAIYDSSLAKVVQSTGTVTAATTNYCWTWTRQVLTGAGPYYLMWASDSNTARFYSGGSTIEIGVANAGTLKAFFYCANALAAGVMPAACGAQTNQTDGASFKLRPYVE